MNSMLLQQQQPLRFDRHAPWRPGLDHVTDIRTEDLPTDNAALCCVECLHPITDHAASLALAGGQLHVFTNPGGYTYELALYSYADCVAYGPATTEYTWFAGYAWQLALCANCRAHLGWRYRGAGSAVFYGLIRDRLREVKT